MAPTASRYPAEMTTPLTPLNPDDSRPASQQIADAIRADIHKGHLKPGDALPNTTVLAEHYGVARNTILAALRLLRADQLVTSRPGRGTFVREGAAEAAAESGDLAARVAALEARVAELEKRL